MFTFVGRAIIVFRYGSASFIVTSEVFDIKYCCESSNFFLMVLCVSLLSAAVAVIHALCMSFSFILNFVTRVL